MGEEGDLRWVVTANWRSFLKVSLSFIGVDVVALIFWPLFLARHYRYLAAYFNSSAFYHDTVKLRPFANFLIRQPKSSSWRPY